MIDHLQEQGLQPPSESSVPPDARAIVDALPIPAAISDSRGYILHLNTAFTRAYGYEREDIPTIAVWWQTAYPEPRYRDWVTRTWEARLIAARITGTSFAPLEVCLRCKGGNTKTVAASSTPLNAIGDGLDLVTLYDLSERLEMERVLRQSDEVLQRAQSVARIGSFEMGQDTESFTCSRETLRLFDLGKSKITSFGKWFSRVHPDDQQAVASAWGAALNGAPYEMTYRIVVRGKTVWIRAFAELDFDRQGRLVKAVGTVQDISDLKLLEIALQESQRRLLRVLEGSDQGFWDWQVQSNTFSVSPRFETMLGYEPGEMQLQPANWSEYVHQDDLRASMQSIQMLLEGNSAKHEFELRCRAKNGDWRWILTQGAIVERDAEGRPLIVSGTHSDITDRKKAEEKLTEHKERLDLALAGSGAVIWDWDIEGHEVRCDGDWQNLLGFSTEALGRREEDWLRLIHPSDAEPFRLKLVAHMQGDTPVFQSEHRLSHLDGHWVPVEAYGRVSARDAAGNPVRMVGTVKDVSQKKRLQDEGVSLLKRIESLIKANASSGPSKSSDNPPDENDHLTRRQREISIMIARGMTSSQIGKQLNLATPTVISHRRNLMEKLGLHSAAEVTRYVLGRGWLDNE